jgi:aminoglycoside phosphotransferase (APT) family kinase protein
MTLFASQSADGFSDFNVDGLCQLAAESVNRSPADFVNLAKLAEGGFNRTFLITMRDGFQMVARIPYLATLPKYYALASEVATMALLRSSALPVPEVCGYSSMWRKPSTSLWGSSEVPS